MQDSCEHLSKCGFFINFKGNSEVIKNGWIRMFCENKEKSDNCERKKFKQKNGKPPVDNMTPTGILL